MDTFATLDPSLPLTADELAAAWNADPECQAVAEAIVQPPAAAQYDFGLTAGAVLFFVAKAAGSAVVGEVTRRLLTKLVDRWKQQHGSAALGPTIVIEQPVRGALLLVVTTDEEPPA